MKAYAILVFLILIISNCSLVKTREKTRAVLLTITDSSTNLFHPIDSDFTIDNGILSVLYRFYNVDTLYNNRYKYNVVFKEDDCVDCDTIVEYGHVAKGQVGLAVFTQEVIFDYEWWPNGKRKINNTIVKNNGKLIIERLQTDSFGNTVSLKKYVFYKDTVMEIFGGSVSGWFKLKTE